jgi:hypothetical protein
MADEGFCGCKSPLVSKTIGFNGVSFIAALLILFLPLKFQVSPWIWPLAIMAVNGANIGLRFVTTRAISFFWRKKNAES